MFSMPSLPSWPAWLSTTAAKKYATENQQGVKLVGVLVGLFVGHKAMRNYCPWYKKLTGSNDDANRAPKLNPVMNTARVY